MDGDPCALWQTDHVDTCCYCVRSCSAHIIGSPCRLHTHYSYYRLVKATLNAGVGGKKSRKIVSICDNL